MNDWATPNKRKRKRETWGKAKLKKRENKFGAPEKKNKRDGWGGDSKRGDWGARPDKKDNAQPRAKRGNWISKIVAGGRKAKRWNDLWAKRDAFESEVRKQSGDREARIARRATQWEGALQQFQGFKPTGEQTDALNQYFGAEDGEADNVRSFINTASSILISSYSEKQKRGALRDISAMLGDVQGQSITAEQRSQLEALAANSGDKQSSINSLVGIFASAFTDRKMKETGQMSKALESVVGFVGKLIPK